MASCTDVCRSVLLNRLVPRSENWNRFNDEFVDNKNYVFTLLKNTALAGENNSALIIGPRGSGKSSLVNSVVADLEKIPDFSKSCVVIRLHGFFQTDDRLAIQEITRQLFLEEKAAGKTFGSFSENLTFLLESLKLADRKSSKSIILIIDEFDQFCEHKNQTLLYNLFDVCQSAQAPMAVIGLTCRMDAISLLEKRVRSRFSHRQIYLLAKPNFENFVETFKSFLVVEVSAGLKPIYVRSWNKSVDDLIEDEELETTLKKLFHLSSRYRLMQNILFVAVSQLSESHPFISVKDILTAYGSQVTDCKTLQLQGLSVLELQLLLAMKYIEKHYHGELCNFEMAFNEYSKQMRTGSMQKFDRLIALKALEHLETLELIKPAEGSSLSKVQREYIFYHVLVTSDQLRSALERFTNLPTEVKQWADSCL